MRWPSIQVGDQPLNSPFDEHVGAFDQAARHGEDQRHRDVGGVVGQDARRVGHRDAAGARRFKIDIVDAGAEIGDQLQLFAGARQNAAHRAGR